MIEQLYPVKLIQKSPVYALILGLAYAVIGIGVAVFLFPEDPAIVAVAITSLIFYPTINALMKQEESIESKKSEFNVFIFLKDHKDIFLIYILFFIGVLMAFASFALLLPSLATNHIFENQINVMYGNSGAATFQANLFKDIFANNIVVMLIIFSTAFFLGDGGILLITWNASVWGTIFGNLAKTAALNSHNNQFYYFLIVILIVFPHMILEAFSYVISAITGGVISKAVIYEKWLSIRFNYIIMNTIISLFFSLIVLVIAVTIETFVLGNAATYQTIIRQSFGG